MSLLSVFKSRNENELIMLKKAITTLEDECALVTRPSELKVIVDYVGAGCSNVVRITPVSAQSKIIEANATKGIAYRRMTPVENDRARMEFDIGDYRFQVWYRSSRKAQ